MEHKPKMIVCGYSAYSRILDFARFRKIADKVGAYLMADIAHIAGLVAAGEHPSPVPLCRFRHHDDAQDPARPARRHDHVQGEVRQGRGQGHLPRHPGRPARACHRGQGRLLQGSARAGVQGLPAPGQEERPGPGPAPDRGRVPHRLGRHGEPPHARGPDAQEHHGQGRRDTRSTRPASPATRTASPTTRSRRSPRAASAWARRSSPRAACASPR